MPPLRQYKHTQKTIQNCNSDQKWKQNIFFDWMSSALAAAQMYAAQLSSQQQPNMYVIEI